jgi:hypothetical protein
MAMARRSTVAIGAGGEAGVPAEAASPHRRGDTTKRYSPEERRARLTELESGSETMAGTRAWNRVGQDRRHGGRAIRSFALGLRPE